MLTPEVVPKSDFSSLLSALQTEISWVERNSLLSFSSSGLKPNVTLINV